MLNFTFVHNRNTISNGHCFDLVMGYVNHGRTEHFVNFYQFGTSFLAQLSVKVGKRFVQEEERRLFYKRAAESNTLFLTTGKFMGFFMFLTTQVENVQCLVSTFFDFFFRKFLQYETKGDVFPNSQVREQCVALEYHCNITFSGRNIIYNFTIHVKFASGNIFKACHHTQGSSFTATRRSQEN